jgi:hypothetical protein
MDTSVTFTPLWLMQGRNTVQDTCTWRRSTTCTSSCTAGSAADRLVDQLGSILARMLAVAQHPGTCAVVAVLLAAEPHPAASPSAVAPSASPAVILVSMIPP